MKVEILRLAIMRSQKLGLFRKNGNCDRYLEGEQPIFKSCTICVAAEQGSACTGRVMGNISEQNHSASATITSNKVRLKTRYVVALLQLPNNKIQFEESFSCLFYRVYHCSNFKK